jgi:hypothetical protein
MRSSAPMERPVLLKIKSGWLAKANGWAVEGATRGAAIRAFREAENRHREIDSRPVPAQLTHNSEQEGLGHGKQ